MIANRVAVLALLAAAATTTTSAVGYLRLRAERGVHIDTGAMRIEALERAVAERPTCPPAPGPALDLAPGALAIYQRIMSAITPDTARRVALALARYVERNFAGTLPRRGEHYAGARAAQGISSATASGSSHVSSP